MLTYLSVCSGIEAASVAWQPLGWKALAFSEIEAFPSAVLAHHYPDVPNLGDMTRFQEWPDLEPDILVGGTPCQSFSVAGLRAGLDDPRGELMLVYGAIARRYRPQWLVWENVPGVLSSNGGRDFGTFLGMLAELGYGFAYRVLDAQFFGVAQKRRRVFVVGHLGDWRRAAAVLFERESLSGNPAPSREAGQGVARIVGGGPDGGRIAGAVTSKWAKGSGGPAGDECANMIALAPRSAGFNWQNGGGYGNANDGLGITLEGVGPLSRNQVPAVAFKDSHYTRGKDGAPPEIAPPLSHDADKGDQDTLVAAYAFQPRIARNGRGDMGDVASALTAQAGETGKGDAAPCVAVRDASQTMRVRRLTPRECERLQGFPDDWTLVPYRGKHAADGPRYAAIGNSMAVPVMRWIAERIALVEANFAAEQAWRKQA